MLRWATIHESSKLLSIVLECEDVHARRVDKTISIRFQVRCLQANSPGQPTRNAALSRHRVEREQLPLGTVADLEPLRWKRRRKDETSAIKLDRTFEDDYVSFLYIGRRNSVCHVYPSNLPLIVRHCWR